MLMNNINDKFRSSVQKRVNLESLKKVDSQQEPPIKNQHEVLAMIYPLIYFASFVGTYELFRCVLNWKRQCLESLEHSLKEQTDNDSDHLSDVLPLQMNPIVNPVDLVVDRGEQNQALALIKKDVKSSN